MLNATKGNVNQILIEISQEIADLTQQIKDTQDQTALDLAMDSLNFAMGVAGGALSFKEAMKPKAGAAAEKRKREEPAGGEGEDGGDLEIDGDSLDSVVGPIIDAVDEAMESKSQIAALKDQIASLRQLASQVQGMGEDIDHLATLSASITDNAALPDILPQLTILSINESVIDSFFAALATRLPPGPAQQIQLYLSTIHDRFGAVANWAIAAANVKTLQKQIGFQGDTISQLGGLLVNAGQSFQQDNYTLLFATQLARYKQAVLYRTTVSDMQKVYNQLEFVQLQPVGIPIPQAPPSFATLQQWVLPLLLVFLVLAWILTSLLE